MMNQWLPLLPLEPWHVLAHGAVSLKNGYRVLKDVLSGPVYLQRFVKEVAKDTTLL